MNAQNILKPDIEAISKFLYALFAPAWVNSYPDAYFQLAFGHPTIRDGSIDDAQIWRIHDLKGAADFVARKNSAGYNIYTSPALLQFPNRSEAPNKRADDDKYLASAFAWAEFDGLGDAERVDAILKDRKIVPALVVTTGTVPHPRMHLYFNVSDLRDAEHQKSVNKALRSLLTTDEVTRACQLMRIAGTINYPTSKKAKERGYVTELTSLRKVADAPVYRADQLISLAPVEENCPHAEYGKEFGSHGKSDDELMALLNATRIKGQWHNSMRNATASMVGKGWPRLAIKATCAPFADGGLDDEDVEKLIDSAVAKFGKPEEPHVQTEPHAKSMASSALALTYYSDLSDTTTLKLWIIKSVLARGETSNWFGPPGVGKSVLMTDLVFHVAAGLDWRGHRLKECCGVVCRPRWINCWPKRSTAQKVLEDAVKARQTRIGHRRRHILAQGALCRGNRHRSVGVLASEALLSITVDELDAFEQEDCQGLGRG